MYKSGASSREAVKISSPEDIAGLVSYLVSPEAKMITGQSVRNIFQYLCVIKSNNFFHLSLTGLYQWRKVLRLNVDENGPGGKLDEISHPNLG